MRHLRSPTENDSGRQESAPVEGEDFYREGAYVVFTAAYHLRRGYCCESGCRHCPYRDTAEGSAVVNKETEER
jgi:2-iminoacetate synthase ThiH